jgi:hypothetical protein
MMVVTTGFNRTYSSPNNPSHHFSGFTRMAFMHVFAKNRWYKLPPFPSKSRQGMRSVVVGNSIYCWGGWKYKAMTASQEKWFRVNKKPYPDKVGRTAFQDGYRLYMNKTKKNWQWKPIIPLPYRLTNFGTCVDGTRVYIFGGATIHPSHKSKQFSSSINKCGARLHVLDLGVAPHEWKELPICPGTPRFNPTITIVGRSLYVLGGIYPNSKWTYKTITRRGKFRYYSIFDNWKYDLDTEQWTELARNPYPLTGWGSTASAGRCVFQNQILLMGAAVHGNIGLYKNNYTKVKIPKRMALKEGSKMLLAARNIMIYDIATDRFLVEPSLFPVGINTPVYQIVGNIIHYVSGEVRGYKSYKLLDKMFDGPHLNVYLRGKISASPKAKIVPKPLGGVNLVPIPIKATQRPKNKVSHKPTMKIQLSYTYCDLNTMKKTRLSKDWPFIKGLNLKKKVLIKYTSFNNKSGTGPYRKKQCGRVAVAQLFLQNGKYRDIELVNNQHANCRLSGISLRIISV